MVVTATTTILTQTHTQQPSSFNVLSQDQYVSLASRNLESSSSSSIISWGLDRLDQQHPELDNTFHSRYTGQGVDVFVLDSGVLRTHPEFRRGQTICSFNALPNNMNRTDDGAATAADSDDCSDTTGHVRFLLVFMLLFLYNTPNHSLLIRFLMLLPTDRYLFFRNPPTGNARVIHYCRPDYGGGARRHLAHCQGGQCHGVGSIVGHDSGHPTRHSTTNRRVPQCQSHSAPQH
jgi:hypothetical protein